VTVKISLNYKYFSKNIIFIFKINEIQNVIIFDCEVFFGLTSGPNMGYFRREKAPLAESGKRSEDNIVTSFGCDQKLVFRRR